MAPVLPHPRKIFAPDESGRVVLAVPAKSPLCPRRKGGFTKRPTEGTSIFSAFVSGGGVAEQASTGPRQPLPDQPIP
mgnify:CR=1 FL=1